MNLTDYARKIAAEAYVDGPVDEPTAEQWRGVIPPFTDEPVDLDEPVPYVPADPPSWTYERRETSHAIVNPDGKAVAFAIGAVEALALVEALNRDTHGAENVAVLTRRIDGLIETNTVLDGHRLVAEQRCRNLRRELDRLRADRDEVHARVRNSVVDLADFLGVRVTGR